MEDHHPVPIFLYHRITSGWRAARPGDTLRDFRHQLDLLDQWGWSSMSLTELVECTRCGKTINTSVYTLTFDDGYRDLLDHAVPELEKRKLKALFFVSSGLSNACWLRQRDPMPELFRPDELRDLIRRGFEVGCHGATHIRLNGLSRRQLVQEIIDAGEMLASACNGKIEHFSYPYGAHDDAVRSAVREAGYLSACTARKGWVAADSDVYQLPRLSLARALRCGFPPFPRSR
ncbi:MAG: polysaccharide deacetylase family protein [Acidobacteria bacterium]|nr:polysaccharide deacetylase family protein [Acidobacteriota bacterium]